MQTRHTFQTAVDIKARVSDLEAERAAARLAGLQDNLLFMGDLDSEIAATKAAYVGAAVTEIATLRGMLSGRRHG
jgi:hypothetical protein